MNVSRFAVGARHFCIDRGALRGVIPTPSLSGIPLAPDWLVGAYNNLGRAVAAVDAAALLGLGSVIRPPVCLLLVEGPAGLLGLLSDGEPDEVVAPTAPRRGAVVEVVDRGVDLLRIDLPLLEARIEAALTDPGTDAL